MAAHSMSFMLEALNEHPSQLQRLRFLTFVVEGDPMAGGTGKSVSDV